LIPLHRLAVVAVVTLLALSFRPVYATTAKTCDVLESLEFNSESRTASYDIAINLAHVRPPTTYFAVEVNGDPKPASFEVVSNDANFPIYKAEVTGRTLSPIDTTGPDKFPFDRYEIDILIRIPLEPEIFCHVNPPALKGQLLQANIVVLSNFSPVDASIELSRPVVWQSVIMIWALAAAPLLGLVVLKKKTNKLLSGLLSGSFVSPGLVYFFSCIPSRNALSYFELTVVTAAAVTVIVSVVVILRRR
jgi:hypothetical protein